MGGSLINGLMGGPAKTAPEVGMGVTITYWSDRDPATVVAVKVFKSGPREGEPREIDIQPDDWTVISGSEGDGSAVYEYSRNENAPIVTYIRNKKGRWVRKGQGGKGPGLAIGCRSRYYDPHF